LLDIHFARSFYKHILGHPVGFQDLEAVDPGYYKSMKMILDNNLEDLGVEMTFSTEVCVFGSLVVADLKENGRNIPVTDQNKEEYVHLIANHKMSASLKDQIDAFLEGFYKLVPLEVISIFDAQQLELLVCGLPEIDMDDLRAYTTYHGYKQSDAQITYLWNVVRTFSKEEKALFLQFVTGTSKVPLDGFKALQGNGGTKHFNVHKAYDNKLLPTAHTCFNQLDLPEYLTEEDLRQKLLIAIHEGSEGFAFA
jgi:E3 ubiquitin-protein ligase HUWE1